MLVCELPSFEPCTVDVPTTHDSTLRLTSTFRTPARPKNDRTDRSPEDEPTSTSVRPVPSTRVFEPLVHQCTRATSKPCKETSLLL